MSSVDLRVAHSVELVCALKRTVAEFAAREEKMSRELLTRRALVNRTARDGAERIEARLEAALADADARAAAARERVSALYAGRRAKIEQASAAGLRALPNRAQAAKERWMGELQLRKFRAERALTLGMEGAGAEHGQFAGEIGALRALVSNVEMQTRRSFRGYGMFTRMLGRTVIDGEAGDLYELPPALAAAVAEAEQRLAEFRAFVIPRAFSDVPLLVLALPIVMLGVLLAVVLGGTEAACWIAGGGAAALLALAVAIHQFGMTQAKPAAVALAASIAEAHRLHEDCVVSAAAKYETDRARVQDEHDRTVAEIEAQWERADDIEVEFAEKAREKIETQTPRVLAKIAKNERPKLLRIDAERVALRDRIKDDAEARAGEIRRTQEAGVAELTADETAAWQGITNDWQRAITPLHEEIVRMNTVTAQCFPEWSEGFVNAWTPGGEFLPAVKFGSMDVEVAPAKDSRLALPFEMSVSVPLALTFPGQGSLLFETNEAAGAEIVGALDNVILRLLATTPPGKISFTIIDPVGLGQSFAGLMHLADYEESLINRRIWTQRDQIDDRLAEMSEHIEKVIQMYLRNEYATITEYNAEAGSVAEKYHFLVVADFPANFSESAARRLQSIAASGARCGIFTLIHWDRRQPLPEGFAADDLRQNSVAIRREGSDFILNKQQTDAGARLVLDGPPEPELAVALVHKIGRASVDSNRVEVPFAQIAPATVDLWTNDTTNELKIAVGRTGATKQQYLAIGKGTRQHALFAGKTGSGKSTLFHVIITNLALACSPEQVEFYLIDFKKGVEFKCYATKRLPHARVVAIESDREFALSVLQRVDAELKRRGDLFRALGVQDIAGYKKAGGTEPMPRSLLLIDEFQEFFVEDDAIAQTASLLFDRIVRQGRAFGIHALLGSQSLGGAYSLARATIGQMVIRVALQCNEADAYLIMDDTNSAPRLLSRPGEGIYNDAGGAIEGNSPFQVVWLPDDERDVWLDKVRVLAEQRPGQHASPIVFEGNAPADIRENDLLRDLLANKSAIAPPRIWLGAPNSIKGPTEVVFQRQSGNHLLIVGQREEVALSMIAVSLLALAAQHRAGDVRLVLFHNANPGSPDADAIDQISAALPNGITIVRPQDVAATMKELAAEMKDRAPDAPPVFVFIHGLQKFKKLRHEDDFSFSTSDAEASAGAQFTDLICEGSATGIHIVATVDTFNNVNRAMSRKALSEFEMRVVFQMSANDSASLIDSPRASALGLHRALYFNEQAGALETFRPYAMPDAEWVREAGGKLRHT